MKKIIAMLLALVMVLGLAACASKTEPAQTEEPAATETTPAAEETTEETTEEPAEATEEPATTEATGSVYYLNFKPEADEAWQKLAATYTEQTGVPVKVVTAASGTYDTTLDRRAGQELRSDPLPVRQPGRPSTPDGDYCYPLDGTAIMDQMTTDAFNLKGEDGQTAVHRLLLRSIRHHRQQGSA